MASKPPDSKLIKAAGAVAWRPGPDGGEPRVLLVHRKKYDDWSLPKGKQEPAEPLPLTAVREVREEGGARLVLDRRLGSVRYHVNGRPKRVHYWAARVAGTDEAAVPNEEVDQIAWLTVPEAKQRASYPRDHGVLDEFARAPGATVPLILLRHAKALPKSSWSRDDASRPLEDSGIADAQALAGLLACFAPAGRVLSSPAVRCMETVRPYAELTGTDVLATSSLELSRTDRAVSAAVISDALAAGEPTVICAHRENLPALLAAAGDALGAAVPPDDRGDPLPTAAFWVLHVTGGALAAAELYDLSDTLASGTRASAARKRRRRSRSTTQPASSTTATMIA
jgi:8-oxo-dGTP pyrophosphatase MutT (NUDIX family)/phosphohistidine phosphatase SixA